MTGVLCTCAGGGTDRHAGFVGGLGTLGASFSGCAVASEVDVVSANSVGDSVPPCAAPSATSAAIGPRAYEGKGALVGVPAALDSFPVPSVREEASPLADFFTTCAQADVIGFCETSSRSFSCLHHSDYFVGWVCVWQHRMRFVVLSSAPAVIHTLVLLVSLGSPPPSMGQHVSTSPPRPEFSTSFHVPWTGTPFSSISFALVSRCRHGHVSTPWFSFLSDSDGVCRLPCVPTSVSLPFSFRHVSFVSSCFSPRTCFGPCVCEMAVLRSASIACCASDLLVFDTQMSCGGAPFRIGFERETPFQSGPKRSGGIPQEKGNRPEGEEAIRSTQDEGRPLVEMGRRSQDGEKGSPDRVGPDRGVPIAEGKKSGGWGSGFDPILPRSRESKPTHTQTKRKLIPRTQEGWQVHNLA